MQELIIRTKKSKLWLGVFCVIACIAFSILCFYISFNEFSNNPLGNRLKIWLLIGMPCLLFGIALARYYWRLKDDYIMINSEGITINAHSKELFFPKFYRDTYQWSELSSYALDMNTKSPGYGIELYEYQLEVYDTNGLLLKRYVFQENFGMEMLELDDYMSEHLLIRPVYEFNEYGKTTLYARKSKMGFVMTAILWGCIITLFAMRSDMSGEMGYYYGLIGFFALMSIWYIHTNRLKNKDSLTLDQDGISVDLHTTELCRHIHKNVNYDSIHSFSVFSDAVQCRLEIWDEKEKKILSCDCFRLSQSRYLEIILKGILS